MVASIILGLVVDTFIIVATLVAFRASVVASTPSLRDIIAFVEQTMGTLAEKQELIIT